MSLPRLRQYVYQLTKYTQLISVSQIQNVILIITVAIAAKRIQFDRPEVLSWLRALFFASNLGVLCCCFIIHWKIRRKADATVLVYRKQENERVSPQRQEPITVYAHDRKFLLTLYKIPIRGLLIVAITHFYLKSTKPLILQSILPLKSLWEANLCQVYLRGQEATGQLHRPWKQRASPRQVMTKYVGYAFWLWRGKATAGDSASKQPGGQSIQDTEKEHSRKASK